MFDFLFKDIFSLSPPSHRSPFCQNELSPVWVMCDVALLHQLRHPSKQADWQPQTYRDMEEYTQKN